MTYKHHIEGVTISWRHGQSCISICEHDRVIDVIGLPEDEDPVMDEIELYADGWMLDNSLQQREK
jgi:hypothetical protein